MLEEWRIEIERREKEIEREREREGEINKERKRKYGVVWYLLRQRIEKMWVGQNFISNNKKGQLSLQHQIRI